MAREITYLLDVFLITCVVEAGIADKIINAATSVSSRCHHKLCKRYWSKR